MPGNFIKFGLKRRFLALFFKKALPSEPFRARQLFWYYVGDFATSWRDHGNCVIATDMEETIKHMKKWMILAVLATIFGAFMTGCTPPADAGTENATTGEKPAGETATPAEGGSDAATNSSTEAPANTDAGTTDGAANTDAGTATDGAANTDAAANTPATDGEHKTDDGHGHTEGEAKTEGGH